MLEWYQLYDQSKYSDYEIAQNIFNIKYLDQLNVSKQKNFVKNKPILISEQKSVIRSLQKDINKVCEKQVQIKKVKFCPDVKVVIIPGKNIYYCVMTNNIRLQDG